MSGYMAIFISVLYTSEQKAQRRLATGGTSRVPVGQVSPEHTQINDSILSVYR